MKTVAQMLSTKGSDVWSVRSTATVFEALEKLAEYDVGALPVIDDGNLVGMLSERDYARKVVLVGVASKDTPVSQIMTSSVVVVSPETTVSECMSLMTGRRIRHLPVVEDGAVVGLVSIGDVVSAMISEQEFMIEQLERYIAT